MLWIASEIFMLTSRRFLYRTNFYGRLFHIKVCFAASDSIGWNCSRLSFLPVWALSQYSWMMVSPWAATYLCISYDRKKRKGYLKPR